LAAAEGSTNQQIAAALKIPAITVGKWRRSFARHGVEGLRDAPRSGRPPTHDAETRHTVHTRVCQQPDDQSRWTVRTLAAELGLPASTVHAMLVAAKLQPHRIRTFTFSPDPDVEAKLLDIIGLYLNPPEHAFVLCVDEKPGIQALDRTQPLLPLRAKKPRAWTNEYVRHGTQTLLAALEIATGPVVAHVRDRRTTVDFLRFMDDVVRAYPVRDLHVVLDNLNIHKNEAAQQWLLHPHPAGPHAERATVQEGLEGLAASIPQDIQRASYAVHLDQRAGTLPAHHRSRQALPGNPSQATTTTEGQSRYYEELTGRCTSFPAATADASQRAGPAQRKPTVGCAVSGAVKLR